MSTLTVNLSQEIDQKLTEIANRNGITKAETIKTEKQKSILIRGLIFSALLALGEIA